MKRVHDRLCSGIRKSRLHAESKRIPRDDVRFSFIPCWHALVPNSHPLSIRSMSSCAKNSTRWYRPSSLVLWPRLARGVRVHVRGPEVGLVDSRVLVRRTLDDWEPALDKE